VPTYQYACTDCDHAFEQVQSFSDDSLTVCPACEGRLRKIFNAVGVVFKGSGFYRTDSRSEGKAADGRSGEGKTADGKSAEGKAGGAKEGTDTSTPAKTEASTAAKGEPGTAKSKAGAA
jgi:putative FmdB family regulatory protein